MPAAPRAVSAWPFEYLATPDATFPKYCRLTGAEEYSRVFKNRCNAGDALFVCYAAPKVSEQTRPTEQARLGLAVSRKVSPRAVVRNRIKRLIRESFRQSKQKLGGLDIVIVARPQASKADVTDMGKSLQILWGLLVKKCKKP
ncbi:MAG TPA: ribonuclease P protein component [Acidiferrobacteraceae bacterium]|nr:ribonuclease P protein component [Acidiferrobacteraceae bacterium]